MTKFYQEHALPLSDHGFNPFPTRPGSKAPYMDRDEPWNGPKSREKVQEYLDKGRGDGGVALTGLGAIDFDITDETVAKKMCQFFKENISEDAPNRVGNFPKFLVPVSAESAIGKKWKNTKYNKAGKKQEIEFLSPDGQYFLVLGIHPDTGKEYYYLPGKTILDVKAEDLPVVDGIALAMIEDEFNRLADEQGWTRQNPKKKSKGDSNPRKKLPVEEQLDLLEGLKPPGGADLAELQSCLEKLPQKYCDDREEWIRIMSAIHHGTDGSDEGLELANNFSKKSPKYRGIEDIQARWKSFSTSKGGEDCATVATIVHILKEEGLFDQVQEQAPQDAGFPAQINAAQNRTALKKVMKKIRKKQYIDALDRNDLGYLIRDRAKVLNINWKIQDIQKKLKPDASLGEDGWLEDWYYLVNQNKFARVGVDYMTQRPAFNEMYNRLLKDRPDIKDKHRDADKYALEVAEIPCVHDLLYYPGAGSTFNFNGKEVVNSFNPETFGPRIVKSGWTEQDHAAVDLFLKHIHEMFDRPGEARLLLDAMAHILQHPMERLRWVLVMYGCEGDGKTTLCRPLARGVGAVNSGIVNGSEIVGSSFSDWAMGCIFRIIEELKVPGRNRYEAIEKIKTFITNDIISVRPMYQASKMIPNTASLFATTNHRDAIPYNDDSRRFAVIGSKWGSTHQILDKYGPNYFANLIAVLERHEAAISEYLATFQISESFSAHQLPRTPTLDKYIQAEKSELYLLIEEMILGGKTRGIGLKVIVLITLRTKIEKMIDGNESVLTAYPQLWEIKGVLEQLKYSRSVEQVTISGKGTYPYLKDIPEKRDLIISEIENRKIDEKAFF